MCMHVHLSFYTRPHRNINTHVFNAKGSKQNQSNHVSFHGVDENNDDRDEGDGVLLLRPLLLLVPGPLNKESGDVSERTWALRVAGSYLTTKKEEFASLRNQLNRDSTRKQREDRPECTMSL